MANQQLEKIIKFNCDRCERPIKASARLIGTKANCPHCKKKIIVGKMLVGTRGVSEFPEALNRRQTRRFAVRDSQVRFKSAVNAKRVTDLGGTLQIQDLSTSGVNFKLRQPAYGQVDGGLSNITEKNLDFIQSGKELALSLDIPAYFKPLDVKGKICRVTHTDRGTEVGVEFTHCDLESRSKLRRLSENPMLRNCNRQG